MWTISFTYGIYAGQQDNTSLVISSSELSSGGITHKSWSELQVVRVLWHSISTIHVTFWASVTCTHSSTGY
ncbi:MAG: hypothetical protein IPJ13_07975 [Saprospiraceae bacterium]|nr:hypothetical protein [Saprospiraceae bacterium]